MNSIILTAVCAMALGAAPAPARPDTVDRYVIDSRKVEHFDGSQLVGKAIDSWTVTIAKSDSRKKVYRVHEITTSPNVFRLDGNFAPSEEQMEKIRELTDKYMKLGKNLQGNIFGVNLPTSPLIIVDGKTVPDGDLSGLDPAEIVSVVVYDPMSEQARSYGEAGKNGVLVLTTSSSPDAPAKPAYVVMIDGKKTSETALAGLQADKIESVTVYKAPEQVKNYTDIPNATVIVLTTKK